MSLEVEAYCNDMPLTVEWLNLNDAEIHDIVKSIIMRGAEEIKNIARDLAPVRTGKLRDSIQVYERVDGATVLASAPYAAAVEMGHLTPSGSFVAGQRFLSKAAHQVIPSVAAEIERNVNEYLRGQTL